MIAPRAAGSPVFYAQSFEAHGRPTVGILCVIPRLEIQLRGVKAAVEVGRLGFAVHRDGEQPSWRKRHRIAERLMRRNAGRDGQACARRARLGRLLLHDVGMDRAVRIMQFHRRSRSCRLLMDLPDDDVAAIRQVIDVHPRRKARTALVDVPRPPLFEFRSRIFGVGRRRRRSRGNTHDDAVAALPFEILAAIRLQPAAADRIRAAIAIRVDGELQRSEGRRARRRRGRDRAGGLCLLGTQYRHRGCETHGKIVHLIPPVRVEQSPIPSSPRPRSPPERGFGASLDRRGHLLWTTSI